MSKSKLNWPKGATGPRFPPIDTVSQNTHSEGSEAAGNAAVVMTGPQPRVMEAALVLASQRIEAVVLPSADTRCHQLVVKPHDFAAARSQLAHYARENRHRRWRQSFAGRRFEFDWQCLVWAFLVMGCYYFQSHGPLQIRTLGDFNSSLVRSGEWWRSITAELLHADLLHLASNTVTGMIFFGVAMAEYGAGVALLVATLCGALANLGALALRSHPYHGLGASGVVMAALGLLAVRSFRWADWRHRPGLTFSRGFLAGVLLFILFGFNPSSDVLVHGLGFALGALAGLLLQPLVENTARQARWDGLSKWIFVAVVAIAWGTALWPASQRVLDR